MKTKQILSLLLSVLLVFSICSIGIHAELSDNSNNITLDSNEVELNGNSENIESDKMITYKTVSSADELERIYKTTISAYATGEIEKKTINIPVDFLIIFDKSSSMHNGKKLNEMKAGIKHFVNLIQSNYSPTTDHRIAFLGFTESTYLYNTKEHDFTKVPLSLISNKFYNTDPAKSCWISANDTNTLNAIQSKITSRILLGVTETDQAFRLVNEVIYPNYYTNNTYTEHGRAKIVILYSDGLPTTGWTPYNTLEAYKDRAISQAKKIKDTGTAIYTIGVGDATKAEGAEFLRYCSSSYPNATSTSNHGQRIQKEYSFISYSQSDITNAFQTITADLPTVSINIDENAILKDNISQYFHLYIDQNHPITIQTQKHNGHDEFTSLDKSFELTGFQNSYSNGGLELTLSEQSISLQGFDYVKNFVSHTNKNGNAQNPDYGQRLCISYYIKATDSFMGGNGVQSSTDINSGVFANIDDNFPIKSFPINKINVPIRANLTTTNSVSWHGEEALNNKNVYDFATITAPIPETYNLNNNGLDNINNAFVKIEENYYDGETLVAKHTVLPYNEDEYEFYSAEFMSGNKNTVPATLKEYIEYKALNANENQFVQPIRVVATVSPIYTIDENDPQGTSIVQNSLGDAVSEQTANATYTITYNFCTLTIGQNEYDYVNGKFRDKSNNFYDIYYNNEYYMSVLGGTTIYEMPVGNYKVVLHTSDTRYNKIEQWEVASTATSEGIASSDNSVSFELSRKYYENHLTVTPDASYYTRQSQYLDNHNTLVRNAASSTRSINGSYSVVS